MYDEQEGIEEEAVMPRFMGMCENDYSFNASLKPEFGNMLIIGTRTRIFLVGFLTPTPFILYNHNL